MDVKKMLAVGTAIVGTVAMADGIVSSSVVGYATSKEIAANTFSLGTTPFTAVGSDLVKVQDMLVPNGVAAVPYSQRTTKALQLQVWNGVGYTMYYYLSDAYDEANDEEKEGWANGAGDYVEETVADVNYGFWARSLGGSGTITFEM